MACLDRDEGLRGLILGQPTMKDSLEVETKICVHNVYIRMRERGQKARELDGRENFEPWMMSAIYKE